MQSFVTPPPLSRGSRVLVVAPSSGGGATARHVVHLGLTRLRNEFDLEPIVHPTARQSDAYLRAHPESRAAAIHEGFRDPSIDGIIATIGGDDQLRVLAHLDPDLLRAKPTRFFGMSDNTNLCSYLWNQGIVSFYGAQLMNQIATPGGIHPHSREYIERAFFEDSIGKLHPAAEWADLTIGWHHADYADRKLQYVRSDGWRWTGGAGRAVGRIWGGCLAILEWQLMTDRYVPAAELLDGRILALETSEETPSAARVRRFLMCLGERGLLERFDGVLVGRPATQNWLESRDRAEQEAYREAQREAIRMQLDRYNPDVPVVFDLEFGHTDPTVPLPIGGLVEIVPEERIAIVEE